MLIFGACACAKMEMEDAGVGAAPNDYVVDWAPVTLTIVVSDSEGHDLIHPDMEGASVVFQGKIYEVQTLPGVDAIFPSTRYTITTIYGLFVQKCQYTDHSGFHHGYRLVFGDIDGALDMEEDITFKWKGGKTYTIHYSCSEHIAGPYPRCTRVWTINGKRTELPIEINI